jgi:ATP synthase protein I
MARPTDKMSDPSKPPSFDDLGNRISKVRREAGLDEPEGADTDHAVGAGLGAGWRISIEIVTALFVCTGIGWSLDYWLGTKPWLMLVFLVLGAAAGINNAVRTALRIDAAAAERQKRGAGKSKE